MITLQDIKIGNKFETEDGRLKVEIVNIDEYSPGIPRIRAKMEGHKEVYADTVGEILAFLNEEGFHKVPAVVPGIVSEGADMTKAEIQKMIKDAVTIKSEEDVKEIVRKMLKKQYKTFWEKSSLFIDKL